jgi:hypothetical protein
VGIEVAAAVVVTVTIRFPITGLERPVGLQDIEGN